MYAPHAARGFGGNLGLVRHYSESKTAFMCKLLMRVQLYHGIFNIYTVMNTPADLRYRMTENKAAFNRAKPALWVQVPEQSGHLLCSL